MDRNTIIGFSLIFLILAGYYSYTAPTPEQADQMQRTQDSLAKVEQLNAEKVKKAEELTANASDSLRSSSDSSNVISANNNSAFQQPVVASISPETLKNIVL